MQQKIPSPKPRQTLRASLSAPVPRPTVVQSSSFAMLYRPAHSQLGSTAVGGTWDQKIGVMGGSACLESCVAVLTKSTWVPGFCTALNADATNSASYCSRCCRLNSESARWPRACRHTTEMLRPMMVHGKSRFLPSSARGLVQPMHPSPRTWRRQQRHRASPATRGHHRRHR